jgi:hypothetical protein
MLTKSQLKGSGVRNIGSGAAPKQTPAHKQKVKAMVKKIVDSGEDPDDLIKEVQDTLSGGAVEDHPEFLKNIPVLGEALGIVKKIQEGVDKIPESKSSRAKLDARLKHFGMGMHAGGVWDDFWTGFEHLEQKSIRDTRSSIIVS